MLKLHPQVITTLQATYTLLLERMAADRQAVESMISRVKATASKTAAKMTGRGSGPHPTWETG